MTTLLNIWRRCMAGATLAAGIGLAVFSLPAIGDEMRIPLTGDQEVPPVKTMATGVAVINIKPDMTVSGQVTTTGVASTMAHIHLGAAGGNGPVQINFVRNGDNGWLVPEGVKLTDSQYEAFKAGNLYINVHSAENKAGELRGQIRP